MRENRIICALFKVTVNHLLADVEGFLFVFSTHAVVFP